MNKDFIEEQVKIAGDVVLKGTLALPESEDEKLPAVLIINGSGNGDRDGNVKMPVINANIYKDLAHYITGLGFITLRYDKRGVGESQGDIFSRGVVELLNDINAIIQFLKNHPKVDKDNIIMLGHSEGCILSTISNATTPVGGLILLSGAGVNLRDALQYQNEQIIDQIERMKGLKGCIVRLILNGEKLQKKQEDLYKKVINSTENTIKHKFKKISAKWMREHFKYSSEDILNKLDSARCPILAVTGEKDAQANPEDLKKIDKMGKKNIECIVIENMDHMLKEFTGEKNILTIIKQYKKEASQPLHPQLKAVLGQWLKNNF